jgi:hypothetical protein
MAKSEKRSKESSKKSSTNNAARDWIIRGAVFGVLAILLVLALLDYQTKQAAAATATGWRDAVRSKDEMQELKKSEFKKLAVKGSPTITSFQSETRSIDSNSIDTYSWKGIFRTYNVRVSFGLGNDPSVESIEGP